MTSKNDLTDAGAVELDETGATAVEDQALDHAVGGHGYLFEPPGRVSKVTTAEGTEGDTSSTTVPPRRG
ncbi:MAG: hypothetical protein AAGH74_13325 [Pseudomonadota bacterium]